MSKRLTGDLGAALYAVSCRARTHPATFMMCVNALRVVLDANGEDFRLFLQAAGADDDEQAAGRMRQ